MRIIAGAWRGRTIESPDDTAVRPTSDKVRGAIFNILAHGKFLVEPFAESTRVLDGFCGTGALGLEALSRGAGYCLFIDSAIPSLKLAKSNAETFKAGKRAGFEMRDLTEKQEWRYEPFGLIFLDPPYRKDLALQALNILEKGGFIAPQALAVVETGRSETLSPPPRWQEADQRSWGQTAAHFLIRKE